MSSPGLPRSTLSNGIEQRPGSRLDWSSDARSRTVVIRAGDFAPERFDHRRQPLIAAECHEVCDGSARRRGPASTSFFSQPNPFRRWLSIAASASSSRSARANRSMAVN